MWSTSALQDCLHLIVNQTIAGKTFKVFQVQGVAVKVTDLATGFRDLVDEPDFARRDEHGITLGYRVTPVRKVKGELFTRIVFLDYDGPVRQDWNYATGASLTYSFTPHLSLSGFVSWTDNESNLNVGGDYETWTSGLRLGGYWQF